MCKHVALVLRNTPGQFHFVTEQLLRNEINILGFCMHTEGRTGFLNLLCSPHDKALRALAEAKNVHCCEREVVVVQTSHRVGAIEPILRLLRDADINLQTSYVAMLSDASIAVVLEIRNPADQAKAKQVLQQTGHALINNF